jgi:hypothetical protein
LAEGDEMHRRLKDEDVWTTREGQDIPVKNMASAHLLSAIHLIERSRYQKATDAAMRQAVDPLSEEMVSYYLQWPTQYYSLVTEAVRRGLIYRPVEQAEASNSLTRIPRKKISDGK